MIGTRIDLGQNLTLFHRGVVGDEDLLELSGDLTTHQYLGNGLQSAGGCHLRTDVSPFERLDTILGSRLLILSRRPPPHAAAHQEQQQYTDYDFFIHEISSGEI